MSWAHRRLEKFEDGQWSLIRSLQEIIFDLDMSELCLRRCRAQAEGGPKGGDAIKSSSDRPANGQGHTFDLTFLGGGGRAEASAHEMPRHVKSQGQSMACDSTIPLQISPNTLDLEARLTRVKQARARLQRRAQEAHTALASRSDSITGIIGRMQHLLDLADSSVASKIEHESKKVLDKLVANDLRLKSHQGRLVLELEAIRAETVARADADGGAALEALDLEVDRGRDPVEDGVVALDECIALASASLRKLDQVFCLVHRRARS